MRSVLMALLVSAAACGGGGPDGKIVFTTSADFVGGFAASQPVTVDGASIADQQCQSAAQGAGLDGTFVAWMSRSATTSLPQRNAIDVVSSDGPWVLVTGGRPFMNHSALANTPLAQIEVDEYGRQVFGPVWTGTDIGGTLAADCGAWHSASPGVMGTVGSSYADSSDWTNQTEYPCDQRAHYFCFEL